MTNIHGGLKVSHRLFSLPAFAAALYFLLKAWNASSLQHGLLGVGLLLAGAFAFRHNLLDTSARANSAKNIGLPWMAVLFVSVLLILGAAVVAIAA